MIHIEHWDPDWRNRLKNFDSVFSPSSERPQPSQKAAEMDLSVEQPAENLSASPVMCEVPPSMSVEEFKKTYPETILSVTLNLGASVVCQIVEGNKVFISTSATVHLSGAQSAQAKPIFLYAGGSWVSDSNKAKDWLAKNEGKGGVEFRLESANSMVAWSLLCIVFCWLCRAFVLACFFFEFGVQSYIYIYISCFFAVECSWTFRVWGVFGRGRASRENRFFSSHTVWLVRAFGETWRDGLQGDRPWSGQTSRCKAGWVGRQGGRQACGIFGLQAEPCPSETCEGFQLSRIHQLHEAVRIEIFAVGVACLGVYLNMNPHLTCGCFALNLFWN